MVFHHVSETIIPCFIPHNPTIMEVIAMGIKRIRGNAVIIAALAVMLAGIAAAGIASAGYYGMGRQASGMGMQASPVLHGQLGEIVESGSYEDLLAFREANGGIGGPWWVDSEEDFQAWQARHLEIEENGYSSRYMQNGRRGQAGIGGCPMMSW